MYSRDLIFRNTHRRRTMFTVIETLGYQKYVLARCTFIIMHHIPYNYDFNKGHTLKIGLRCPRGQFHHVIRKEADRREEIRTENGTKTAVVDPNLSRSLHPQIRAHAHKPTHTQTHTQACTYSRRSIVTRLAEGKT